MKNKKKNFISGVTYSVSFLGIILNILCFIIQIKSFHRPSNLFSLLLNLSDFFFSVYLSLISIVDMHFNKFYIDFDETWRKSITCTISGILLNSSSLLSLISLFLLTFDKVLIINKGIQYHEISLIQSIFSIFFSLILCLILSILPVFIYDVNFII